MNVPDTIIETPNICTQPVEMWTWGTLKIMRIELHDEGRIFTLVKEDKLIGRYAHMQNALYAMDREGTMR